MIKAPKPPGFFARMILALPVVRRLRAELKATQHELTEKLEDALEQIEQSKTENPKPKIQPAAGPLAADEVLDAYNVTEREPWFAATVQEVDGLIEDATRAVEEKPTAPASAEARTHAAGGLFALRDLRERLHALRDTATKREDTEDKAA